MTSFFFETLLCFFWNTFVFFFETHDHDQLQSENNKEKKILCYTQEQVSEDAVVVPKKHRPNKLYLHTVV